MDSSSASETMPPLPPTEVSSEVVAQTSEEGFEGRTVTIALDRSERSRDAFAWTLANLHRPMDKVILVHASQFPVAVSLSAAPALYENFNEDKREAHEMLRKYATYCAQHNITYEAKHFVGSSEYVFSEVTERTSSKAIVLGNHSKGSVERFFVGSTSESALHNSHIPVAIVKRPHVVSMEPDKGRRIAIAVDDSQEAHAAFDWAVKELYRDGDVFYAIHMAAASRKESDQVTEGGEGSSSSDEWMGALSSRGMEEGLDYHFITSRTHRSLPEEFVKFTQSLSVDMLVVGCRGRGTVQRALFGSFSDTVVRQCDCNVIVVKH